MKKVILTAALFTVLSLTALLPAAHAANTASATATATANIVRGLTIANTQGLNFGRIVPNEGGVVTVSVKGERSSSDSAMLIPDSYDKPTAAAFDVTGDGGHNFQILLPETATIKSENDKMEVSKFVCSLGDSSTLSGDLNELGTQNFTVGANLTVAASQAVGAYAGTFDVTVTYQ